jgi:hypothetical protein
MMRRMMTGAVTALLALQAGAALAQASCPTAADLAGGIRVDFENQFSEVYQQLSPGVVLAVGTYSDGTGHEIELGLGLHVMAYRAMADGVVLPEGGSTTDYGMPASELPLPGPGARWQLEVKSTDSSGTRDEVLRYAADTVSQIQIGACTYDRMTMLIAFDTEDNYVEAVEYLPALGISYLIWGESDGTVAEPNRATAISVVTK